ncbi:MAG: hypothetical protein ACO3QP_05665 [Burkholderiaceae bacterium]|jgi:hypothetical protein
MLGKIVIVLLAVGLALLALRSALGKSKKPTEPSPQDDASSRGPKGPSRLYPCARCGAMTPQEDVSWREGKPYCSRAHAEL